MGGGDAGALARSGGVGIRNDKCLRDRDDGSTVLGVTAGGIGTLNESSLHAGIKDFLSLPGDRFEVPLDGFVIDIVRDQLLIEIQTGSFGALGNKLDRLLGDRRIHVVHPIAIDTWIARPGKRPRKSPKHGTVLDLFAELVSLPTLLDHPNLSLEVLLIEEEQLREPGRRGERKSMDRRLRAVRGTRRFDEVGELATLLPIGLQEPWTTADLAQSAGISRRLAQSMAYCLRMNELVVEHGRDRTGRSYTLAPRPR